MTAFGPVATGNMNAKLALIAAGTMISLGSTPAATAPAASIGMSSAVVAVLLVISVRKLTDSAVTMMTSAIGNALMPTSASPTSALRPDAANALELLPTVRTRNDRAY